MGGGHSSVIIFVKMTCSVSGACKHDALGIGYVSRAQQTSVGIKVAVGGIGCPLAAVYKEPCIIEENSCDEKNGDDDNGSRP